MDLLTTTLFVIGLAMLIVGAEFLVRGASGLARAAGISPLVVGLTVVAYGTSAPEAAVTIQSVYVDPPRPDLAIGNIVGSNIANILLVLGVSAAVAPLVVSRQLVRSSVPFMIAVSVLVMGLASDGTISRLDGLVLFTGSILYSVIAINRSRGEMRAAAGSKKEEQEKSRAAVRLALELGLIAVGLVLLLLGADFLVDSAVTVAAVLGVSELVIGLTIVAVGTSLPEIATSIVASLRGERDIAVGNVVGSNIFNLLLVLGLCAVVAPDGVRVSPAVLRFDLPVMIAVSLACLPVFFTGYRIARWEGLVFLGYYAAFTIYLFLRATEHEAEEAFGRAMLTFVVPLTTMTLVVLAAQSLLNKQRGGQDDK